VTSSLPKRVPGVTVEIAVQRPTFSVDIRVKACDEQGKWGSIERANCA
jgi:hypothetical protein